MQRPKLPHKCDFHYLDSDKETNATLTPAAKKQQLEQSDSVWYVAQKLLEK